MENQYKRDFYISYTDTNRGLELSLINAIYLVQNLLYRL